MKFWNLTEIKEQNTGMYNPTTQQATEYIKKFPKAGNQTIAKLLIKDHPALYNSLDHARICVRRLRGAAGPEDRKSLKDKSMYTKEAFEKLWNVKEGISEVMDPYELVGAKKVLYISDVHIPFHDRECLLSALEYGYKKGVDTIVLNGDIWDCYSYSRWIKDPRLRRPVEELEQVRSFLRELRQNFTNCQIVYKEGNHEERWSDYLKIKAPEIFEIDEFNLDIIFKLGELKIRWINDRQTIRAGKLLVYHGHELGQGIFSPVNPARGLFNKVYTTAMMAHSHQPSFHPGKTGKGEIIGTWSIGCLSNLTPRYRPVNQWIHGFGYQEIESDGTFDFENRKIIKGKIV